MSGRKLLIVVGSIPDDALDVLLMANSRLRRLTVLRIENDELPNLEHARYALTSERLAAFRSQHSIDADEVHAVVCGEYDWYQPDRPDINLADVHAFYNLHSDEWPTLSLVHVLRGDGSYTLE